MRDKPDQRIIHVPRFDAAGRDSIDLPIRELSFRCTRFVAIHQTVNRQHNSVHVEYVLMYVPSQFEKYFVTTSMTAVYLSYRNMPYSDRLHSGYDIYPLQRFYHLSTDGIPIEHTLQCDLQVVNHQSCSRPV